MQVITGDNWFEEFKKIVTNNEITVVVIINKYPCDSEIIKARLIDEIHSSQIPKLDSDYCIIWIRQPLIKLNMTKYKSPQTDLDRQIILNDYVTRKKFIIDYSTCSTNHFCVENDIDDIYVKYHYPKSTESNKTNIFTFITIVAVAVIILIKIRG